MFLITGKEKLYSDQFTTPLGMMMTIGSDKGILLLEFADIQLIDKEITRIRVRYGADIIRSAYNVIEQLKSELNEYFEGNRKVFDVPLIISGSGFQQKVWSSLQKIPFGEKTSYINQAMTIGNKNFVRAVAKANASNRILILIPCHRVTGKNGQLTGYSGGLWRKTWLLNHERSLSPGSELF